MNVHSTAISLSSLDISYHIINDISDSTSWYYHPSTRTQGYKLTTKAVTARKATNNTEQAHRCHDTDHGRFFQNSKFADFKTLFTSGILGVYTHLHHHTIHLGYLVDFPSQKTFFFGDCFNEFSLSFPVTSARKVANTQMNSLF